VKPIEEADLRALDEYRRSFSDAYAFVVHEVRVKMNISPTGRRVKSVSSIVAKLQRESIRLSQMQDIAGCRVVLQDIADQKKVAIEILEKIFPKTKLVDRRTNPSSGYRATHVIVSVNGKPIEVQVRSRLQHLWAEFSERLSDTDTAVKYGGGPKEIQDMLSTFSGLVLNVEENELKIASLEDTEGPILLELQEEIKKQREEIATLLKKYDDAQTKITRRSP
jgi:ppGpp synthetase/RelA/SpoT-type nucleotidyltranferase